ncbi:kinase-like domain-containing protein [Phycomyces blakesleeanus]
MLETDHLQTITKEIVRTDPQSNIISRPTQQRKQNRLGPYLLLRTLGEGEFGKVKLGMHIETGQEVAVKLIKKTIVDSTCRANKIEREVSILKSLNHPFIVKLVHVVETDKHIGIILEYASGGELFEYIFAHRYLKEKDAQRLFAQLISSVQYMHQKKIVHRDLKLENLLLDRNRNVIVTDFGFANQFEDNDDLMSTSCGSPCYAAPELVVTDGLYTGSAVDIWSCGVILYAMLCGYLPFDDDPANPKGNNINLLYRYILSTQLAFPIHVGPEAQDLLQKMLVPDPVKRSSLQSIINHPWLTSYRHLFNFSSQQSDPEHSQSISVSNKETQDCEDLENPIYDDKATVRRDPVDSRVAAEVFDAKASINVRPQARILLPDSGSSNSIIDVHSQDQDRSGIGSCALTSGCFSCTEQPSKIVTNAPVEKARQKHKSRASDLLSSLVKSKHEPADKRLSVIENNPTPEAVPSPSFSRQNSRWMTTICSRTLPHSSARPFSDDRPRSLQTSIYDCIQHTKRTRLDPQTAKEQHQQHQQHQQQQQQRQQNSPVSRGTRQPHITSTLVDTRHIAPEDRIILTEPEARHGMEWQRNPTNKRHSWIPLSIDPSVSVQSNSWLDNKAKKGTGQKVMAWIKRKSRGKDRRQTMDGRVCTPVSPTTGSYSVQGLSSYESPPDNTVSEAHIENLRIHEGAIDRDGLSSRSPTEIMASLEKTLKALGIDVKYDGEYCLKCIRRKVRVPVSTDSQPHQLSAGFNLEPVYGDPAFDCGDEVRFIVEVCRFRNLPHLYIVDIRRLKGNVWVYKFLYRKLFGLIDLGSQGGSQGYL